MAGEIGIGIGALVIVTIETAEVGEATAAVLVLEEWGALLREGVGGRPQPCHRSLCWDHWRHWGGC